MTESICECLSRVGEGLNRVGEHLGNNDNRRSVGAILVITAAIAWGAYKATGDSNPLLGWMSLGLAVSGLLVTSGLVDEADPEPAPRPNQVL